MKSLKFFASFIGTAVFVMIFSSSQAQAPQITQQPNSLIKCVGNSGVVALVATGAAPISYQWYKNGNPYGPDSPTLDFPAISETDEGDYYCEVSNGEGSVTSFTVHVVNVNGSPVINDIITENDLVCLGTDNLFSSDYSGENVSVAWYHNSGVVDYGADYNVVDATLADEGTYYYTATNACQSVMSDEVSIDVVIPAEITTQPLTQTICEGEDAVFSAVATGDYLYYIWMRNDVLMPSEQTNELTVADVAYPHEYYYNLIAYNICDQDTSNSVYILVNNIPQIVGQPVDHNNCMSEEVTLYAYAGGTTQVNYQWYQLGAGIVDGETADSFSPEMIAGDTTYYYCEMSNICGTVYSDTAMVVVKEAPVITQQPSGGVYCAGQNVSIQVKADGTDPLYYQWLFNGADVNGTNITGDEAETIHFSGINEGQQGYYSCHVSNVCGYVVSDEALITVNIAPLVTEQPEDASVCEGGELSLNISSQGTEPVGFEWYLLAGHVLMGTDQDYITTDADPANSGEYFCILTNSCGVVSTDTVSVEIRALPVVTVQPVGDEVCVGESVQMEIEATGAEPLDFLWYRNGSAVSGETNNIISYVSAQVNQTGAYFCRAMNDCGYDDSDIVDLLVGTPPAITWNPIDQNLCELETLNLIMDAQGDNYSLQWYFNNSPVSGENDTVLNIPMVHLANAGVFYCLAYNSCASVSTDTVEVVVNPAPAIDLGEDIDLCAGESVTIGPENNYVHYDWNSGLSNQPTLEVHLGGTFILDVTGVNSCHNRDTLVVTFHPYHQILFGPETIIACGSYVLNAGEGAYSYLWNTTPPQTTSSITVNVTDSVSVVVLGDSFGCETSQTVFVDVRTPISFELGADVSAPVDSFVNIGLSPVFSQYYWNTGFTGPMLTVYGANWGLGTHEFWLTATALNGCSHTDTINVFFYNGSGIKINDEIPEIIVFPNPATDYVRFESEQTLLDNIEVYNISGELVAKEIINSAEFSLNVSNFAKGLYMIKIQAQDNKVFTRKILIQ